MCVRVHMRARVCVLFRIKSAERQYLDAFEDELQSFIKRLEACAKARIEDAMREHEEEERQKRLGPGGLDPLEVIETLPKVQVY